jgi:hypothetical protein
MSNYQTNHYRYVDIFRKILAGNPMPHIRAISQAIIENGIEKDSVEQALGQAGIDDIIYLKDDVLDLLLAYIHLILDDHYISEGEHRDVSLLKILFKIEEGDFYSKRYHQVKDVLQSQVQMVWGANNDVSIKEALHKVNLQDLFDLSYDQFVEFENIIEPFPVKQAVDFKPKFEI